jgi:hypothetical protein
MIDRMNKSAEGALGSFRRPDLATSRDRERNERQEIDLRARFSPRRGFVPQKTYHTSYRTSFSL